MSVRISGLLLGAALALAVTAAQAAEEGIDSANYILPGCKLSSSSFLYGRCAGIVEGVAQTLRLLKVDDAGDAQQVHPLLCVDIPDDVTKGQLVRVVVRHGEVHPERTNAPFFVFAITAIRQAWPCK